MTVSVVKKIIAVAPLLMMIVSLPDQLMLRCRMDGTLRPACCCPDDDATAPPAGPSARQADCCDPELSATIRAPAEQTGTTDPVGPRWSTSLATLASDAPVLRPFDVAPGRPDPARARPPIVLLKHAFLI